MLSRVARRVRDAWRGETDATLFDLRDLGAVSRLLAEHAPGFTWDGQPSDPLNGARAERVYELRPDLRAAFPLGLTPHPQRASYLVWLLTHGRAAFDLTPAECLAHLLAVDATPDRGLERTYRLQPEWQKAVGQALTQAGWPQLKRYLADRYGLRGRWFERAALPPQPPAAGPGLNVLAHFRYDSGLQQAAVWLSAAAERAGLAVSRRDLPVIYPCDWTDRSDTLGLEPFSVSAWVSAVNTYPSEFLPIAGLHPRAGVKRVAVWYWELDELPADWRPHLDWPDEVWAPTRFIADAFRKTLSKPVVPMLPGVELPPFRPLPRSHFGLPADRFLVLFSFDMGSVMARKNPLALVDAFRRAFRADDWAHLCIKVSRGSADPAGLAELRAACEAAGATLFDRVLPRGEALALLASADCYASLHRSEGFGLGLAESMLLGKPVVATGYSGNLDFMDESNSFLVRHTLVPIRATANAGAVVANPYQSGNWAEPDVGHAAELLRRVYGDRDGAAAVAERGRAGVRERLSLDAYGRRVAERVRILGERGA